MAETILNGLLFGCFFVIGMTGTAFTLFACLFLLSSLLEALDRRHKG